MKQFIIYLSFFSFSGLLGLPQCEAADVRLVWDANTESDLAGYRVYWGEDSRGYQEQADAGRNTNYTVRSLAAGRRYFFTVTAYDASGRESTFSNEVAQWTPANDGVPDPAARQDLDADGDGISDFDEQNRYHTDAAAADSDGDGVSDGREVSDHSDPLDRGSFIPVFGSTICLPWNSFLGPMWNIMETSNNGGSEIAVNLSVHDLQGGEVERSDLTIEAGGEFDALVHETFQRHGLADSYGLACATAEGGEFDSRMLYYKPHAGSQQFEFALALAPTSGTTGSQFLTFNTYQPSLNPADQENAIAVWHQLANRSSSSQNGRLITYDEKGAVVSDVDVSLPAGARRDFPGHDAGRNVVGLVEWRPDSTSSDALFDFSSVRYLYDNPVLLPSFTTAFQLTAAPGSGALLAAPLDTAGKSAILEIANTRDAAVSAQVRIYGANGALLAEFAPNLEAHASIHIISDPMLQGQKGLATVQGSEPGAVYAVSMHYARDAAAGINSMYGIPAKEALLRSAAGSYNTWLGQNAQLWLLNPWAASGSAVVRLRDKDGVQLTETTLSVAPHGIQTLDLNSIAGPDAYGRTTVETGTENPPLVAWITRERPGEYLLPLPLLPMN